MSPDQTNQVLLGAMLGYIIGAALILAYQKIRWWLYEKSRETRIEGIHETALQRVMNREIEEDNAQPSEPVGWEEVNSLERELLKQYVDKTRS